MQSLTNNNYSKMKHRNLNSCRSERKNSWHNNKKNLNDDIIKSLIGKYKPKVYNIKKQDYMRDQMRLA